MRYEAACDLHFMSGPQTTDPLDVCPAGTVLQLVSTVELTWQEADSLSRLADPKKRGPDVRILPFRWDDRVRFLRLGSEVRPVDETPARAPRRVTEAEESPEAPETRPTARRVPRR